MVGSTTSDWCQLDLTLFAVTLCSHHPASYPVNTPSIQAMSSQFLQGNAEGKNIKCFAEVLQNEHISNRLRHDDLKFVFNLSSGIKQKFRYSAVFIPVVWF